MRKLTVSDTYVYPADRLVEFSKESDDPLTNRLGEMVEGFNQAFMQVGDFEGDINTVKGQVEDLMMQIGWAFEDLVNGKTKKAREDDAKTYMNMIKEQKEKIMKLLNEAQDDADNAFVEFDKVTN